MKPVLSSPGSTPANWHRVWKLGADIDTDVLSLARRGHFTPRSVQHLPPRLLAKYFRPANDGYQMNEELRQTELELMRSRDRFSDLYDFAPVGYLTINLEGTVLEANLTAAKMLGVVRNRLVAQPFSRFIEHNSQDSFYRHRRAVFSSGKPDTCELVLRRADRTGLPVHLESLPVTGDAVRIRQCRIALVDVTELKRTEAALMRSESGLAVAQRIAHMGSWEWNVQTGELRWSEELYRIYGIDPKAGVPSI